MGIKPFLKWAGGKRWLANRTEFLIPPYAGRYIEPFLGSGAVFFHHGPKNAILSDLNESLIEVYATIRADWRSVKSLLEVYQDTHDKDFYYRERSITYGTPLERAAQFIYFNRTCWNGLYRVNLSGQFNVPIGTKSLVVSPEDDFGAVSEYLSGATLSSCDFATTLDCATEGDFVFVDPPCTTAHNMNGFVKYNENIFGWQDQIRLKDCCVAAARRGASVFISNADHHSVRELYRDYSDISEIVRYSVISGSNIGRKETTELLIRLSS